jgi:predicted outer membrane repeat protein
MRTAGGVVAFLLAAAVALTASSVSAGDAVTTYVVTTVQDGDDGPSTDLSLRDAVEAATDDETDSRIVLAIGGDYLLERCSDGVDALVVGGDTATTIEGRGATIEQTCAGERVLQVGGTGAFRLADVTITGGDARTAGGGVVVDGPQLVHVVGSTFTTNRTAADGGGLAVIGAGATIERSLFRDNEARRGGAAWVNGDAVVEASTFTANRASTDGGALYAGRDAKVRRSTFSANVAAEGTGAAIDARSAQLEHVTAFGDRSRPGGAAVRTRDLGLRSGGSIVVAAPGGADCDVAGDPFTLGFNRSATATCGFGAASDGQAWVASLAPLGANGGPLPTHLPLATGETVVDVIPATNAELCGGGDAQRYDQRDVGLPQGAGCDIGAVETPDPFTDVTGANSFYGDIARMDADELSSGFGDGTYQPEASVTRGAMAAFLYRVAGSPPFTPSARDTFTDVAEDHPFLDEIAWMAHQGIAGGFDDGTFHPGDPVTRQAMAAFLYRSEHADAELPDTATFSDVPLDHPFANEVEWMAAEGVSAGFPDGSWHPGDQVTRQAVARYLVQLARA